LRASLARAVAIAWLAACGGPQPPPAGDDHAAQAHGQPAPVAYMGTPIEQRRDVACDQLAPKLTACAVEDAKANLAAGKIERSQFDRDTATGVQQKNTDEFEKVCKAKPYSSRQVRVLEVCFHAETQCGPLLDCLGHLSDRAVPTDRGAR
jgi:hypothetical protein